ncbi:death-inducer obliterator 1 [Fopius arisanus]|uniref:DIDO1_0 protein n=1 Tax=Fopius arisanus TaxID=64838 RepID=A0A0C9QSN6_9HYME|nr:PREDICTED: death-inducer obliterator 1 [Fopius arisanus]
MSSSYIVEPRESASKKDDTLIIVVNDDGTISVDQETLQNLIMNQSNANVSVVRVGQTESDAPNGDLTFTVDPPTFGPAEATTAAAVTTTPDIVDPFMEMDPEQLKRLETALQSEQAKQILGENVTAMLDMLTVEEEQNSIRYSIELDHCYTSRTSPADPPPLDPLPVAHSPEIEKVEFLSSVNPQQLADAPETLTPLKSPPKKPVGRPRRTPPGVPVVQSSPSIPESPKGSRLQEDEDSSPFSSSESSESEPSDSDVDFGPRGPRRGGVRARGGRKGLTTRGGSMARRPGRPSKLDNDQVRRLNLEMAAAVDEMKSPLKPETSDLRSKKQIKTMGGKKKEEAPGTPTEPPPSPEKPLQTTNQVKANLISANMIKGDMILTKPGQSRNNQKVYFVQKKIMVKANEIKNFGIRKSPVVITKAPVKLNNQVQTRLSTSQDGKLITVVSKAVAVPPAALPDVPGVVDNTSQLSEVVQISKPLAPQTPVKVKPVELKKEKKEPPKTPEIRTPDPSKKHVKKETKKSPGVFVEALGPALFSTPDIIRRVGSVGEAKAPEHHEPHEQEPHVSPQQPHVSHAPHQPPGVPEEPAPEASPENTPITKDLLGLEENNKDRETLGVGATPDNNLRLEEEPRELSESQDHDKIEKQVTDDLHAVLDPGGIEGNEHLLATLEMEASKHEEELLAEALLLQEQLDVDLTDPSALDGAPPISESLLPPPFDPPLLAEPLPPSKPPEQILEPVIESETFQNPASMSQIDPKKRDTREPIQIVRGGRIITLPPIEAPATRSKRLQSKTESPKPQDPPKREEKQHKPSTPLHQKKFEEMDSEMEDDDEEDNSDSEDDPNRLWCICKRPHNNRFMICCDVCEDWFHGKCVHVSKAMGQQMEEQGIEWVCPNCAKKKGDESTKSQKKSHRSSTPNLKTPEEIPKIAGPMTPGAVTQCVVCKKEARNSSIYCSDVCILAHAQEALTKDKPVQKTPRDGAKGEVSRVIVFERKTGKLLTGSDAPTRANLQNWLREHPTFEAVRPNSLNTIQVAGKTMSTIQVTAKPKSSPSPQAKMVYAKVAGSKQTILAPSKKITVVSPHTSQPKHAHKTYPGGKVTQVLKQTTIKTIPLPPKSPVVIKQQPVIKKTERADKSDKIEKHEKHEKNDKSEKNEKIEKTEQKSTPWKSRKSETEPIRLNIRKSLAEALTSRIKETEDLKLSDEEITELALKIELEMYKYFTGAKYKAKYRSLLFNIKDTKNLTLFRKIADRSLTPDAVVRLSPEEMASQELAEWREKETKHQLEMIKKNELDLMAQAKSIVVKTHKGEQIIENDGGLEAVDPKTPVQDIVTVLNSADNTSSDILEEKEETSSSMEDSRAKKYEDKKKKRDRDREREGHRSRDKEHKESKRDRSSSRNRRHRSRDRSRDRRKSKDGKRDKERDKDREKSREKDKSKDKDKDRSRRSSKSSSRSKSSHRDSHKDKEKKRDVEDDKKKLEEKKKEPAVPPPEKPIEDRLWRHVEEETNTNTLDGNDSDVSDREPSSTVTIKTPDINEDLEREKEVVINIEQPLPPCTAPPPKEVTKSQSPTVWRGFVNMVDVAKFFITAQEISGHAKDLMDDLPDSIDVVGRIGPETVWDYMSKTKKNGSKEILVIRLTAANDEEKIPYITLYSYLNSRSRLGVIGTISSNIKDFYIMPFSSHSQIPPILRPLIGPGFEENRPHLLLGIIIRNKRKRPAITPISQTPLKIPKKDSDRSYTPPPGHLVKEKISSSSEKSDHSDKSLVTQTTLNSLNKAHVGMSRSNLMDSAVISKIVPELSSKLDLTSSPGKPQEDDDDDEPYSPGGIDDEPENTRVKISTSPLLPAKNSNEIQRKVEELNRRIEEQKQQIQNMSSSFIEESVTLPGLGLDPPEDEAYSPTDARSFTPPPQTLGKFPILDKVQDITIPANLQEILANVKRQESSKVDPYLPSKPGASFLTPVVPMKIEKMYTPTAKETKSTLRSLSDLDLIKKAEEELAAVAAASGALDACATSAAGAMEESSFGESDTLEGFSPALTASPSKTRIFEQPKPPGLEDEDIPVFPGSSIPLETPRNEPTKFVPKSGVVLSIKRKIVDDGGAISPPKTPRTKSRWGQGPAD